MRDIMQSLRLSNLTILSLNNENFEKLLKDPNSVLEVFRKMKNRRLQFQI